MSDTQRRIDELEGFWVSEETDRTLHIGFEEAGIVYLDLFDSDKAACVAEGNCCLTTVLLNLRTGAVKIEGGDDER